MTPKRRIVLALLVLLLAAAIIIPVVYLSRPSVQPQIQLTAPEQDCGLLNHFGSEQQLIDHLQLSPSPGPWIVMGGIASGPSDARETAYPGTNVQVQGVDEADLVKTDGVNVYASAWTMNGSSTAIVRAYPPESAALLSRIPGLGWESNLFVAGDRLVLIDAAGSLFFREGPFPYWEPATAVRVYDIADPANPALVRNVTVSGWYSGARMIGDVVYLVANSWIYLGEDEALVLPTITSDGSARTLTYADIGYFADSDGSHVDTIILALNVRTDDPPAFESFLTNGASQLYASLQNLYIASGEWVYEGDTVVVEMSAVHKIAIGGGVRYVCSARIPGTILNQFSMDEWNGDLRVATTFGSWSPEGGRTSAGVYVLDDLLKPLGQVDGLAPGERVYAARFLGARAYLVTYRQVDPLFVIDVSDASHPQVLGYLKIPGVSDYLHPFGTDFLIGLGRNDPDGTGRLHGVKLSLFDVSDVAHPVEVDALVIGDGEYEWAWSEAQMDHRAFLFIPGRNDVVFPVTISSWGSNYTTSDTWAGAYVVAVTAQGFTLRGTVEHGSTGDDYWSNQIRRSLYIGDYLYTVSNGFVVAHDLDTLTEVARVPL